MARSSDNAGAEHADARSAGGGRQVAPSGLVLQKGYDEGVLQKHLSLVSVGRGLHVPG